MKIAVAGGTGRVGRHVVDVLQERGHDVVPMSRSLGVDVVTGEGLIAAVAGVECIIDAATSPSPDKAEATEFFATATRNLQEAGAQADVREILVVSIVGTDEFVSGYNAAKRVHEQAMLAGPVPARIVRATQFHEFVAQFVEWGTQGDICYVPQMRTQPVAARAVAEVLADHVGSGPGPTVNVGGPQEESLVALAELLVARHGDGVRIEPVNDPTDPDSQLWASGALLPGADALLVGPTFEEWLASAS